MALELATAALKKAETSKSDKQCFKSCNEIDTILAAIDHSTQESLLASTLKNDRNLCKKIADVYARQGCLLRVRERNANAQISAANEMRWRGQTEQVPLSPKSILSFGRSGSKKSKKGEYQDKSLNSIIIGSATGVLASLGMPSGASSQVPLEQVNSPHQTSLLLRSTKSNGNVTPSSCRYPTSKITSNNIRPSILRANPESLVSLESPKVQHIFKAPTISNVLSGSESRLSSTERVSAPPVHIFPRNLSKQMINVPVPETSRFHSTAQLAFCSSLLLKRPYFAAHSRGDINNLNQAWMTWMSAMEANEDRKNRIFSLVSQVVTEFVEDSIKDSAVLAEVLLLGPILEYELYRKLLNCLIAEFENSQLTNVDQIQGLIKFVQCASHDYLDSDDLVRILSVLRVRLEQTHIQSTDHPIVLTWAISRILDIMVEARVQDLNRTMDHSPLSTLLEQLVDSPDPHIKYQALYSLQALKYIPDDETRWDYTRRHAGQIVKGLIGVASVCKLELDKFEEGVDQLWKALCDAQRIIIDTVEGVESLVKSGQEILESIKDTFRTGSKRLWYVSLREAEECVRHGRLADFNRLVFEAPCRRDAEFQWGISQLINDIILDQHWDTTTRHQAINFLGELYKNETHWNRNEQVYKEILYILRHITSQKDISINDSAQGVLRCLKTDGDEMKIALYRDCISETLRHVPRYPFSVAHSSKLLSKAQDIPEVEFELLALRDQRLKDGHNTLYIPSQARSNLPIADGTEEPPFSLYEKALEFLNSDGRVFLLLGDSGAGKSTFNQYLEYTLWESYKKGGPIPLYISLPTIDKPEHDMISKQLHIYNFTADQIHELKESRQLILICDGYDESQLKVNLHTTNHLNLPGQWKAKVIISCRTQYLGSDYRGRFKPQINRYNRKAATDTFQEAFIAPFTKSQIHKYVEQYVVKMNPAWTTESFMDKLRRIPNLMDLVSNPFLLTLAIEALPKLVGSQKNLESISITRVELYDNFVTEWLNVSKERLQTSPLVGETQIAFERLLDDGFEWSGIDFARRLAAKIYSEQNGFPIVTYPERDNPQSWKDEFFGVGTEVRHFQMDHLRMSIPLLRYGKQYHFIHRSMLEYFYSRIFVEPDENLTFARSEAIHFQHPLNTLNITNEPAVLEFLAERVITQVAYRNVLDYIVEMSKSTNSISQAAANAITILVKANVRFNGRNLQGIKIRGANLSGGEFDMADFREADLRNVKLARTWFREADFRKARMNGVQFGELPYLTEGDQVWCCAYSTDGMRFATGCREEGISVYNTSSWKKIYCLQTCTKAIQALAFSPNSQQLVSACNSGKIRLWCLKTGSQLRTLNGHGKGVRCIAFSHDGSQIASTGDDKLVIIWNAWSGKVIRTLKGHTNTIYALSYSPNDQELATASGDKTVRLWKVHFGTSTIIGRHSGHVRSIAFSPTDRQIASGGLDGSIIIWQLDPKLPPYHVFRGNGTEIWTIAYSPDGLHIASGGKSSAIQIWNTHSGDRAGEFNGHRGAVSCIKYSPSGSQVASASHDSTVRLWETSHISTTPHSQRAVSVAFSPNGDSIVSAMSDGTICLWDAQHGHCISVFQGHCQQVSHAVFSHDGRQIGACGGNRTLGFWDTETKERWGILTGHTNYITKLAYSPDGRQIASCSYDRSVRIWNTRTGKSGLTLKGHLDRVLCIVFSPNGSQLASSSDDKTVILWSIKTGLCELVINHVQSVLNVVYSPDGERILSCASDAYIWSAATGLLLGLLNGREAKILSASYSPSGDLIATGGIDKSLRLWDAETRECLLVIGGFSGIVKGVTWSPNIKELQLAAISSEGVILHWRIGKHRGKEEGEEYHAQLVWGSRRQGLCLEGVLIQGVIGLSPDLAELFKQRGAEHQATVRKKNKKKRKTVAITEHTILIEE
ncbi:hypothetical protein FBU30_010786 [Linnemannia zychae]|nr:hypothetical protein FBU30_010786 [Linnemannia zychae]